MVQNGTKTQRHQIDQEERLKWHIKQIPFTDNEVCGECDGGPVGQARPVAMSATAGTRFQAGPTER